MQLDMMTEMHNEEQRITHFIKKIHATSLKKLLMPLLLSHANSSLQQAICWGLLFNCNSLMDFFFPLPEDVYGSQSNQCQNPNHNKIASLVQFLKAQPSDLALYVFIIWSWASIQQYLHQTPFTLERNLAVPVLLTELKGYFSILVAPFHPSPEFLF